MKTVNKLNRKEMKNIMGGAVTNAYMCKLASGIGTVVYAGSYSDGQNQCSHYAGINCSAPSVFVLLGEA